MNTEELIIVEVFCQEYEIEVNLIHDLETFGLIEVIEYNHQKYIDKNRLVDFEKIIRLHNDLNINKEGIEIILHLLEKIEKLHSDVKTLKNRLDLYE